MNFLKVGVVAVTCLSLAACSSIGTINGVALDGQRMGATDSGPQPYCDQNDQQRWICIFGAVAFVGGIAAIAASQGHGGTSATPLPPT
jgi:hypothetical protein